MPEQYSGHIVTQEPTEVCFSAGCTSICTRNSQVINIFIFEFFGMVLFSYVVIAYNGIITFPGVWVVETGMFFALVFAGSYGCGYLNPALTLGCAVRIQKRIHPLHALIYWAVQYAGAFVGTFIAWAFDRNLIAPFPDVHPTTQNQLIVFGKEIFGSFLFILSVLIMISSDTTFTRNNFQTWFCVPLCLIAVCQIFGLGLGTNPAQAIAFQVAYFYLTNKPYETLASRTTELQAIWSVVVGATLGGLVAGLFFEFFYRPFIKVYREQQLETASKFNRPINAILLSKSESSPRKVTDMDIQMS